MFVGRSRKIFPSSSRVDFSSSFFSSKSPLGAESEVPRLLALLTVRFIILNPNYFSILAIFPILIRLEPPASNSTRLDSVWNRFATIFLHCLIFDCLYSVFCLLFPQLSQNRRLFQVPSAPLFLKAGRNLQVPAWVPRFEARPSFSLRSSLNFGLNSVPNFVPNSALIPTPIETSDRLRISEAVISRRRFSGTFENSAPFPLSVFLFFFVFLLFSFDSFDLFFEICNFFSDHSRRAFRLFPPPF